MSGAVIELDWAEVTDDQGIICYRAPSEYRKEGSTLAYYLLVPKGRYWGATWLTDSPVAKDNTKELGYFESVPQAQKFLADVEIQLRFRMMMEKWSVS